MGSHCSVQCLLAKSTAWRIVLVLVMNRSCIILCCAVVRIVFVGEACSGHACCVCLSALLVVAVVGCVAMVEVRHVFGFLISSAQLQYNLQFPENGMGRGHMR